MIEKLKIQFKNRKYCTGLSDMNFDSEFHFHSEFELKYMKYFFYKNSLILLVHVNESQIKL